MGNGLSTVTLSPSAPTIPTTTTTTSADPFCTSACVTNLLSEPQDDFLAACSTAFLNFPATVTPPPVTIVILDFITTITDPTVPTTTVTSYSGDVVDEFITESFTEYQTLTIDDTLTVTIPVEVDVTSIVDITSFLATVTLASAPLPAVSVPAITARALGHNGRNPIARAPNASAPAIKARAPVDNGRVGGIVLTRLSNFTASSSAARTASSTPISLPTSSISGLTSSSPSSSLGAASTPSSAASSASSSSTSDSSTPSSPSASSTTSPSSTSAPPETTTSSSSASISSGTTSSSTSSTSTPITTTTSSTASPTPTTSTNACPFGDDLFTSACSCAGITSSTTTLDPLTITSFNYLITETYTPTAIKSDVSVSVDFITVDQTVDIPVTFSTTDATVSVEGPFTVSATVTNVVSVTATILPTCTSYNFVVEGGVYDGEFLSAENYSPAEQTFVDVIVLTTDPTQAQAFAVHADGTVWANDDANIFTTYMDGEISYLMTPESQAHYGASEYPSISCSIDDEGTPSCTYAGNAITFANCDYCTFGHCVGPYNGDDADCTVINLLAVPVGLSSCT